MLGCKATSSEFLTTSSFLRNRGRRGGYALQYLVESRANFHAPQAFWHKCKLKLLLDTPFVFSGTFQRSRRMSREDKKCDKGEAPTPTPKKKHAAAAAAADNTFLESVALISASPTEVSINHPNWQHLMVVNTSAVSALASRGRLLCPWVAWVWLLHSLWSPCPWWPSEAPRDS